MPRQSSKRKPAIFQANHHGYYGNLQVSVNMALNVMSASKHLFNNMICRYGCNQGGLIIIWFVISFVTVVWRMEPGEAI